MVIGLNNSENGMIYELLRNNLSIGKILPGTGLPLNFGLFTIPGQYSVLGTNPIANCIAMMNDTVTVIMNPIPVTDFATNTACFSDTTYFTLSGNFIQRISSWHWDFGDGTFATFNSPFSPSHVYPTYNTYQVTLHVTDTNGCQYTVSHPVVVLPHPTAFFSFTTPNCLGDITHFTDLSQNPAQNGYLQQWTWNFGDGSAPVTINFPSSSNITHTYSLPGTYTVSLVTTNNRGCSDSFQAPITITRKPKSAFSWWSNCQGQSALFYDHSIQYGGGQIASWSWDFGDPSSGALNLSSLQNPQHTYTSPGSFYVRLEVTNLEGCTDTLGQNVSVKTAPAADFTHAPGCLVSPTLFWADTTLINIQATATYLWDFGDGNTSNTRSTQHTYIAAGTYNVTLTITDTAGCEGSKTRSITVTPPPTAHFYSGTDNCQGQSVSFINQSSSPTGFLTIWKWNFGDGSPVQTISFPATPDVTHTYSMPGTFNVSLTVINSEGCSSLETRQLNVFAAPSADFSFTGHCKDEQLSFTDLSTVTGSQAISSWNWSFGDPTSGIYNTSNLQNPVHTFASTGTFIVRLITSTGNACPDTASYPVTIKPLPPTNFSTQNACQDNPAQFTPTGMTTGTIASWHWDFGDGNNSTLQAPSHVYTFAGTYTVLLTVSDTAGCSNSRSHQVTILPLPVVNFDYTSPTCDQDAVHFTDLTTAAAGYAAKWYWDFGDGNTQTVSFPASASVNHTYSLPGTFLVSLMVKTNDSCSSSLQKTLVVLPKPTAAFSHGPACQGAEVSFTDHSLSNNGAGIAGWKWNFGEPTSGTANTSTLQNPTHSYATAGTFNVSLVVSVSGGCSDTLAQQPVTVSAPPVVNFTSSAGCSNDTTQFTSSTLVSVPATGSWLWQFGDGTTSTLVDPLHIYSQAGTYNVTLTIVDTAGCPNTKTNPVTVIPGPLAGFSFSTPNCQGMPVTFTNLASSNGGTITSWYWNFGDGHDTTLSATTPTITHTYSLPGTFLVSYTLLTLEGCNNSLQLPLTISPAPAAAFSFANTCQGQATEFLDLTSLNGGSTLTTHSWNFGDPASGTSNTSNVTNPVHQFAAPGSYLVTLVATNAGGCLDSLQQNITISPKPGVDFYADSVVCLGSVTSFHTDTIATLTPAVQTYQWNFGDGTPGSSLRDPQHGYANAGTYMVSLTITDTAGCENAISHPLTIHTAPVAVFSYLHACASAPTLFTDLSLPPAGDTLVSWYWDFGISGSTTDTSTLKNPAYTYLSPGTYTVALTTTTEHGCSNTRSMPLQVWNQPTASFRYTASPCANGLVQFQDSSWSYQATVTSWQWEFEPYQYGTGENPSHVYYAIDSCYKVKLMISDMRGCLDTLEKTVCVPPQLTTTFDYQQTCFGQPSLFRAQLLTPSAPVDSLITFSWNFGDSQSGTQNTAGTRNAAHTFTSPGYYSVNLGSTDKFGCTASHYQQVRVNALPVAAFSYLPGSCDSTVNFTSLSIDTASSITSYVWNYGDGTIDTIPAPQLSSTHKYLLPGQYTATLTVADSNGCTAVISKSILRSPCLVAAYVQNDTLLCQNYALSFRDQSSCNGTISQWRWEWGDTTVTSYTTYQPLTTHSYSLPGTYSVKLKVSTLAGSSLVSDSTTRSITVISSPLAGFIPKEVCAGQKAVFTDTTSANGALLLRYRWDFGDPNSSKDTSALKNPVYAYPAAGVYKAQLVVSNESGCRDTATNNLNIFALPSAGFSNSVACAGKTTYFFDQTQNALAPVYRWGWRVSDSLTNSFLGYMQGAMPSFVFDSIGSYRVLLTVSDTNGCADTLSSMVHTWSSPLSAFSYKENVKNKQGQLQFTNGTLGATRYYWDFGNGETSTLASPATTYADDGNYTITLVSLNEQGCADTTSENFVMLYKGLWVPNAFAPGGLQQATRNWKPAGVNLATYRCEIFNSFGALLWKSTLLDENGSPVESWDGTYKFNPVQQDVYIWKIQATFRDGSVWNNNDIGNHEGLTSPVWGTVTVIR